MSFADQGLQSAGNLIVNVMLARSLPVEGFASIGLMFGLYYFIFGLHRSSIVLPYILDASAQEPPVSVAGEWWTANVAFNLIAGLGVLAALAVAATLTRTYANIGWVAHSLLYLAIAVVPLLCAEFGRRVLHQAGDQRGAAVASAAYFTVGVVTAYFASRVGSSFIGALAFAGAGLAGSVAFIAQAPPSLAGMVAASARWRLFQSFSSWQSLNSIFYTVYTTGVVVLVGAYGGALAAAAYTAARTLVNPALTIVSAVDSQDKPRAARALTTGGIAALRQSINSTRRLLSVLTGTYLTLVVLLAPWIVELVFGPTYLSAVGAVQVLAVGFFFMCLNQPSETLLVILRASRLLLAVRAGAAIAAIVGIWFGASAGGILGVSLALTFVQLGGLVALRVAEHWAARAWAQANPGLANQIGV